MFVVNWLCRGRAKHWGGEGAKNRWEDSAPFCNPSLTTARVSVALLHVGLLPKWLSVCDANDSVRSSEDKDLAEIPTESPQRAKFRWPEVVGGDQIWL